MTRKHPGPSLFVGATVLSLFALSACSSGDNGSSSGSPGGGPDGGATGNGSGNGTSNGSSSGSANGASNGAGNGSMTSDSGVSSACTDTASQGLDPSQFPECPMCMGRAAHCLGKDLVNTVAADQLENLAECDSDNVCVPDVLIQTLGNYDPPVCESLEGAAGRCLSTCIGRIAGIASFLPQDNCGDDELCAPCVDPRTGEDTGACNLGCDTGPHEPSVVFDRCCDDDSGICVPPEILDERQAKALAQGPCDSGKVCAPELLSEADYIPPTCESVAGAEGRCLSTCVGLVQKESALLPQDTCDADQLCAPCYDPRTGEETGACTINGDEATEDAVVFDTECCGTTGLCVPGAAVPDQFVGLLPQDACDAEGADWVCAPKVKLNDLEAALPSCTAGTGNAGACVPECIADKQIAEDASRSSWFSQDTCDAGWTCAPCEDPSSGTKTGACE